MQEIAGETDAGGEPFADLELSHSVEAQARQRLKFSNSPPVNGKLAPSKPEVSATDYA